MAATGFSGRLTNYWLAIEATRGTGVLPSGDAGGFWIRWETADFFDTATTVLNTSALNQLDKYSGSEIVENWATGQIAGKVTDHAFGLLLYGALGGYAVAAYGAEAAVFQHTFTEDQLNAGPTLSVVRQDPNTTLQYVKGTINQLELDIKTGDFVRHTTSIMSNPGTSAANQAVSYFGDNEFTAKHCTVQFDAGAAIPLASMKITIANDTANYFILGQTTPGDIYQQTFEVKGEMTLRYSDQTYYTLRFNNTQHVVNVQIQNTDVVIGTHVSYPTLTFYMPNAILNDMKVDNKLDGIVEQTLSFEALAIPGVNYAIKAILVNKHTTYASSGTS